MEVYNEKEIPQFNHRKNEYQPELDTLQLARNFLRNHWKEKQIVCPCCSQSVKLRKRKMSANQAHVLYLIYKNSMGEWMHVKEFLRKNAYRNNNDWTLFQHWGMLEPKTDGTTKKSVGYWRITKQGIDFLTGKTTANDCILMYNNCTYPQPESEIKKIYFKDAFKKHFNFDEIMADIASF